MIKCKSSSSTRRFLFSTALLGIILMITGHLVAPTRAAASPSENGVIAQGKFFCPVQTRVVMPFAGTVLSMVAQLAKPVRKGDLIFQYRLDSQEALTLHHRFSRFQIGEMEINLLELDDALIGLQQQKEELETLRRKELAPKKGLDTITRKIQLLIRKKQILQKRLQEERILVEQERHHVGLELGLAHDMDQVPAEAFLRAPMDGYIIWFSPVLRDGAMISKNAPLVQIGIMDPMVIRAQVHEIEAAGIKPGDPAEVSLESIPGRIFEATVQRVPWAPLDTAPNQPTYYEVELSVSNPELLIKEGFKGQVKFLSYRKNTVK